MPSILLDGPPASRMPSRNHVVHGPMAFAGVCTVMWTAEASLSGTATAESAAVVSEGPSKALSERSPAGHQTSTGYRIPRNATLPAQNWSAQRQGNRTYPQTSRSPPEANSRSLVELTHVAGTQGASSSPPAPWVCLRLQLFSPVLSSRFNGPRTLSRQFLFDVYWDHPGDRALPRSCDDWRDGTGFRKWPLREARNAQLPGLPQCLRRSFRDTPSLPGTRGTA